MGLQADQSDHFGDNGSGILRYVVCNKQLIPLLDLINEIYQSIGLSEPRERRLHTTVYEDNNACLQLSKMEMPRTKQRSKHFATRYHWFHEKAPSTRFPSPMLNIRNGQRDPRCLLYCIAQASNVLVSTNDANGIYFVSKCD